MRALVAAVALLFATAAAAQHPIFDLDDAVDPNGREGVLFISRLILGGAMDYVDDFRPVDQNAGFVSIANALYWSDFQFDFKHSQFVAEDDGPQLVYVCSDCNEPVYFPASSVTAVPRSEDTVQFGWYRRSGATTLRTRLTWRHEGIDTEVRSAASNRILERFSGDEQTFGLETDTLLRVGGRRWFGLLAVARSVRSGTTNDGSETAFTYKSLLPAIALRSVLVRGTVTVGGVTGGGTALNVVNPAVEAYWQERWTRANLHLVWSPQLANRGAEGWKANHQIAFFIDRALFVKSSAR